MTHQALETWLPAWRNNDRVRGIFFPQRTQGSCSAENNSESRQEQIESFPKKNVVHSSVWVCKASCDAGMILIISFSTSSALTGGWFIKSPPLRFQMLEGFCKNFCAALQLKLVTWGTGRREKKLRLHRTIFYFVIFAIVLLSFL